MAGEERRRPDEYFTRNKARALSERIDELERTTTERIDRLERRLAFFVGFPVELAKRQTAAIMDAVRTFAERSGGGSDE